MSHPSQSEFIVRAPIENKKSYNVMRFSSSMNVDVTKWKTARMEKEKSIKIEKQAGEEAPKFGLGSEYGKEAKEEARKKRYGNSKKNVDDQPWILKVGGKNGRKFRGTREGGVTENTSYYVFFQAHDGAFEAFPISEWYNFSPIPRYKALTAEEAEEKFEQRGKILNYFTVMASKKKQDGSDGDSLVDSKLLKKKKEKEFKVTEMDDWVEMDDRSEDGESDSDSKEDSKEDIKRKAKNKVRNKGKGKKKGKGSDDDDSEPLEESDEGDFDTREVDYMSDSSSSSEEFEDKVNRQLKGVEDEDGIRQLVISEDEEEENEESKDKAITENFSLEEGKKLFELEGKIKIKQEKDENKSDSSESDESDDSDIDESKFNSAMFMQRDASSSKFRNGSTKETDTSKEDSKVGIKRELIQENEVANKRAKLGDTTKPEAITEEAVKRYLMRKPMTTTGLLQKFKGKKISMSGNELVTTIAQILKKLNPSKQMIKGKLYLSI